MIPLKHDLQPPIPDPIDLLQIRKFYSSSIGFAVCSNIQPTITNSFYDLCGRIYPNLGAHYDQTIGGLITWIPPAMMSVVALLLVRHAVIGRKEFDQ